MSSQSNLNKSLIGRQEYLFAQEKIFLVRASIFLLLHIPLVVLIQRYSIISTFHALITLGIGVFWVLKDQQPERMVYILAYISGSEIIWRATNASIFWEYAKYAASLLLIVVLLKYRLFNRIDYTPVAYFLSFIPSIFVLPSFDRQKIASTLTGPFSLALSLMVFSAVTIKIIHLKRILISLLAPVIGYGFLSLSSTLSSGPEALSGISTKVTTAGYGANQVSSILGLGFLAVVIYLIIEKKHKIFRFLLISIGIWLLLQTMITFSRGGFWTAMGATGSMIFYLTGTDKRSKRMIIAGLVLLVFLFGLTFPLVDRFTGGLLTTRYQDFDLTNRGSLMKSDWEIFKEHPIFGVGPGQSKYEHLFYLGVLSREHTEYSRALAEHGLFGIAALLLIGKISLQRFIQRGKSIEKAITISFTVWTLLFMFHAATRLFAPSFIFGLAAAQFDID